MNKERFNELDRTGTGLTEEELEEGYHWCGSFDGMFIAPHSPEALVCKCNLPAIEKWKESEGGKSDSSDNHPIINR